MLLSVKGMGQSISFTNPFSFQYDGQPHRPNDVIVCSAFSGYIVTRTYTDQFGNSVASPINVGSYTVTVSVTGGCVLSLSQNFTITQAPLTISAISANKIYGTTQGTLIGSTSFNSTGLQNGETIGSVTLNFGVGATAASDPVGSTSVIDPTSPIGGTFTASNYNIIYQSSLLTVIPKSINISVSAMDKVYNGNNSVTIGSLTSNKIISDDVSYLFTSATFNNKNIGTNKVVTVSGITLTGTDAGNYTLTSSTATGTASITVKSLTITPTVTDKEYDGNTTATAALTDNRVSGDVFTVNKTGATFDNKNIGTGKAVTVSGISLTGTDAGNYTITSGTATGTASITIKSLTISATASDKVYDGNTTATATLTDNKISGDDLTVNKTGATFNNKNIGTGKTVTVSGITLTGTDAGNYTLTSATATGTASITVKSLTITPTVTDKEYDGNTTATAALTDNRISGDIFTVNKTGATFNNKNIGVGKTVTVSGITLTGTDAGNYTLISSTTTGTASITVKSLTISATVTDKEYDANTTATAALTDSRISGDVFTVNKTGATFNDKNIGTGKTVTVAGMTLTGRDAGNYTLTSSTATGTASITVKSLTITPTATDKEYDGNTTATVALTDNRVSGDDITVNKTGTTFDNKNIGSGKTVTVAGITLTGTDAGNYSITSSTATGIASITAKSLTITATVTDKEYDGNTTAIAALTDNRVSGDDISVNKTGATFDNKNIGSGKTVTVAGITLTGIDAGNYSITSSTTTGTASITVRSLTISATVSDKVYDGNNSATATLTDNKLSGDDLTVNKTGVTFNNKNAGSGKTVTITGINLTGTDAGNYTLTSSTATGTASITAKSLTISSTVANKEYDGNVNAAVVFSDNRISGDVLTINKTGATFNNKNVGVGKTVTVSGINLTGTDSGNYSIISSAATGTASITAKSLTVSAIAKSKPYDGNKKAEVTLSDNKIIGDIITSSYILAEFDTKEIGDNKIVTVTGISLQGLDSLNYSLTSTTATAYADITGTPEAILVLPNAFTPNGDNNNDEFKVAASNTLGKTSFKSLEIYNRNGKLMFRTEDITQGWNGRYDNVLQDMGVYFVKLVKLNKDGQLVVETSPIYLLK